MLSSEIGLIAQCLVQFQGLDMETEKGGVDLYIHIKYAKSQTYFIDP